MSEQQAPAQQDTPAVAGPNEAPGAAQEQPPYGDPSDPAEKRYSDLRSWTDRVAQEVSELRPYKDQVTELQQKAQWYELLVTSDDPDTRRQAAEVLGYELPEEEGFEPAEYDDPTDSLRSEVTELRQRYEQDQQAAQEAYEGQVIDQMSRQSLKDLDPNLSEEGHNMILAYAINALPAVQQPPGSPVRVLPDVKQAYEIFQAYQTEQQKQWAKTKRAPHVMPGGVTANEAPDTGHGHDSRMNRALRHLQESEMQD
jgi:hypothetical protein